MNLRNVRLLQLAGIVVALTGLAGFWLTRDVQRTILGPGQQGVMGLSDKPDAEPISILVAGRDYDIATYASPCEWQGGRCYRKRTGEFNYGNRTDTIIYASIIGDKLYMINIPRDIYLDEWQTKINAMYGYKGPEGLTRVAADILGLPVDYYAIINIDIFKELVDDIGGVDLTIPYRMHYVDNAAGLVIDFDAGPAHLDGEDAAKFVRYRQTALGDLDRVDNVKRLAYAMLDRLKELNVRAATKLPALIDTYFAEVETNITPALIANLLPRLGSLQIQQAVTLPTCCARTIEGHGDVLGVDPLAVERLVAQTFGGEPRELTAAPDEPLLITNRSGIPGLETLVASRLEALGVPARLIATRVGAVDPSGSHIVATSRAWQAADYYTSLLHVGKQQVARFMAVDDRQVHLELILGGDARSMALVGALAQGGH